MKIVIHTQFRENYGAHNWDGEGECPQYWKNKGGSVFVVPNLTPMQVIEMMTSDSAVMAELRTLIEFSGEGASEHVAHILAADNDETPWEEWETPFQLKNEDGKWIAERFVPAEEYWTGNFAGKSESYVMKAQGDRESYVETYIEKEAA